MKGDGSRDIVRKITGPFTFLRDKDVKTWIKEIKEQFEKTAKEDICAESSRITKDLADDMKAMLDDLSMSIAQEYFIIDRIITADWYDKEV